MIERLRVGRRLSVLLVMTVGGLLLAACGPVEPPNVVGTWYSDGTRVYYRFNEDGTYAAALFEEDFEDQPGIEGEYHFERTRILIQHTQADAIECDLNVGVYDVKRLENGHLTFTLVEDACEIRVVTLEGPADVEAISEFALIGGAD